MIRRALALTTLALTALALAPPAAAQIAFRPAVVQAVDEVIIPAYTRLTAAAVAETAAIARLCAEPSDETLQAARQGFGKVVAAFGEVELYRFGPAREDNRFERLFFWPDRRGRGLRQVQAVIAEADETAATPERLAQKSVAVQGLLALDFVLAGDGHEALLEPGSFRCRYGAAIAVNVAANADAILRGWLDGFADLMREADGRLYRSHAEAAQELMKAGAEQLQIVNDFKLGNVLGDAPGAARPRLAPLWRSGEFLTSVEANLAGVAALGQALAVALPQDESEMGGALAFELRRADGAIREAAADGRPLADLLADPQAHRRLVYARSPIGGAFRLLDQRMPGAMGLTLGFNSLDGD